MFFGLLGPLLVSNGESPVMLTAPRPRVTLAALLTRAGRPVGPDELAELVWDGAPPGHATDTLRTHVMRLRRALGPAAGARIVTRDPGYLIEVAEEELDILLFRIRYRDGAAAIGRGDWAAARSALAASLALWRGDPLADVPSDLLRDAETPALEQARLQALQWRIEADLRLGGGDELVPELRELTRLNPLDESFHGQLMTALVRGGRVAEALTAYQRARQFLVEQLGVEPGPRLRKLHESLLSGDLPPAMADPVEVRQRPRTVPRQLPAQPAHFTGRAEQLRELNALLAGALDTGTVIISAMTGTAGIGKTALALHWAHQVAGQFPDGQLYANLRGFGPVGSPTAPGDVLRGFLQALSDKAARIPPDLDAQAALYRSLTVGRRLLVILDNARDEEQVRPLLPGAGDCLTLVTSRNQLTGLVAGDGAVPLSVGALTADEAGTLLRRRLGGDRVAAAGPGALSGMVTACAGLPLALCVIAARAALQPRQALEHLSAQLRTHVLDALSVTDPRTDPRNVFSWSYRQLSDDAARLFRLCPDFPGPDLTIAAAQSVVPADRAAELIGELASACLLDEYRAGRFRMHDLLASYARERSCIEDPPAGRGEAIRRILTWYTAAAAAVAAVLTPGHHYLPTVSPPVPLPAPPATDSEALSWLEAERLNLIAAVELAAREGLDDIAVVLPRTLWGLFEVTTRWQDWVDTHLIGIESARRIGDLDGQARLYNGLSRALLGLDQAEAAVPVASRALAIRQAQGDRPGEATALGNLSNVYLALGRYDDAISTCQRAIAIMEELGHQREVATGLDNLGWMHHQRGDPTEALRCYLSSRALAAELSDHVTLGVVQDNLAALYIELGRFHEAIEAATAAAEVSDKLGARARVAHARDLLGDALDGAGQADLAREQWSTALAIYSELNDPAAPEIRAKLRAC